MQSIRARQLGFVLSYNFREVYMCMRNNGPSIGRERVGMDARVVSELSLSMASEFSLSVDINDGNVSVTHLNTTRSISMGASPYGHGV